MGQDTNGNERSCIVYTVRERERERYLGQSLVAVGSGAIQHRALRKEYNVEVLNYIMTTGLTVVRR